MAIDPRRIINSGIGLSFAYLIGRTMPPRLGERFAISVADFICAHKSWKLVHATRCNQWVVHGEQLDGAALDQVVRKNFHSIACSIFDLYHNIDNSAEFLRRIVPHPTAIELIKRPEFSSRGLVIAGVHLSNFDMIFQVGGLAGIKALALTLPELSTGYQKQLELRVKKGVHIMQASVGALKHAVNYLQAGGTVITGIDRPDPKYPYRPLFFGRPAALPVHHIFLALKAHVPVILAATLRHPDDKYHLYFSEPIEMRSHPDRYTEIMQNAETVLCHAADFVRMDPSQWSMTFPVWPDSMARVPK